MSIAQPKKNSRKPTLGIGTRVRVAGSEERGTVVGARRPKFARRYAVALDGWAHRPLNYRRDEVEVVG